MSKSRIPKKILNKNVIMSNREDEIQTGTLHLEKCSTGIRKKGRKEERTWEETEEEQWKDKDR
jgi:hypothetical protein